MQLIILQCKNRILLESALRKEFLSICTAEHKILLRPSEIFTYFTSQLYNELSKRQKVQRSRAETKTRQCVLRRFIFILNNIYCGSFIIQKMKSTQPKEKS